MTRGVSLCVSAVDFHRIGWLSMCRLMLRFSTIDFLQRNGKNWPGLYEGNDFSMAFFGWSVAKVVCSSNVRIWLEVLIDAIMCIWWLLLGCGMRIREVYSLMGNESLRYVMLNLWVLWSKWYLLLLHANFQIWGRISWIYAFRCSVRQISCWSFELHLTLKPFFFYQHWK